MKAAPRTGHALTATRRYSTDEFVQRLTDLRLSTMASRIRDLEDRLEKQIATCPLCGARSLKLRRP